LSSFQTKRAGRQAKLKQGFSESLKKVFCSFNNKTGRQEKEMKTVNIRNKKIIQVESIRFETVYIPE